MIKYPNGPMKLLSRVVWSEGMYLGPHHFQVQSRYFEDSIQFATSSLWFSAYGLAGVDLDANALENGTVSLIHAMGAPDPSGADEIGLRAGATLAAALGALAIGIAGASFCAAVHMRARRIHRERMSALTRLIDSGLLSKHSNS